MANAREFGLHLDALSKELVEDKVVEVTRFIALEALHRVVMKSPVGNPDLWRPNQVVHLKRAVTAGENEAYNRANPGRRRKATSTASMKKQIPLAVGKGYVGGRFRANWQVGIGSRPAGVIDAVDPSGQATIAAGSAVIAGLTDKVAIYLVNNLPYADPLENGHSKQAPMGIVAVTIAELNTHFRSL
ncbi:MAG TPA: hypothetical protein VHL98_11075 [Microvirga sp.]|jgi:hypothetical protein|nr:hypothetical protein [Microvirga sp.]